MSAFMVGRQFMVALMMILLGRVTGYSGRDGVIKGDDWGMNKGFNEWALQSGFLGALFVCNVAQLMTQVTASLFPIAFINNRFLIWILRLMLLIEASGIVTACWPLSWAMSYVFGLKPDPIDSTTIDKHVLNRKKSMGIPQQDGDGFADQGTEIKPEADKEHPFMTAYRKFSYVWSVALTIFALVIVVYGMAQHWNNPPWTYDQTHPAADIVIFFLMLFWIALLEGCQISIVGLQAVDMEKYKDSHPRAYKCSKLVHKGPNVERFLVGRQFLLLFNGFMVSRIGGAKREEDFYIGDWEWNTESTQFFWLNSILLLIVIIVPGQLVSQLVAADKMLGFFDLRIVAAYYTVCLPCLFVESIGLTHSSYLLKDICCYVAGIDTSTADPAKEMKKDFLYWARVLLSVSAVIFSGIFLFKGLANGQTNATTGPGWEDLPGGVAVVLALLFLFIMACAEGLQVSALVLAKTKTSEFRKTSPLAYRTCQLLFSGRNMGAFLVGRQFFVALMMVLLGRVLSYSGSDGILKSTGNSTDDWGMGTGFNEALLQTGFLGAILVVNVAQLASQVIASIFPIAFINNRILNWLLRIMLFVEATGIVNACWPLSWGFESLCGLEKDPFDIDEDVKTPSQNILDRKKSMGIPVATDAQGRVVGPFNTDQPDDQFHVTYSYSYTQEQPEEDAKVQKKTTPI
jgi:hypothetical protein